MCHLGQLPLDKIGHGKKIGMPKQLKKLNVHAEAKNGQVLLVFLAKKHHKLRWVSFL